MKTVELRGVVVKDVPSLWEDLLKKEFDVQSVGMSPDATYVYLADDEEKDPRPVIESWAGKPPADLRRKAAEEQMASVRSLLEEAAKRRATRSAARAEAESKERARVSEAFFTTPGPEAGALPKASDSLSAPPPAAAQKERFISKLFKVFRS